MVWLNANNDVLLSTTRNLMTEMDEIALLKRKKNFSIDKQERTENLSKLSE